MAQAEKKGLRALLRKVVGLFLTWGFRLAWAAFCISTPFLGMWVSSSLAAHANGPIWVSAVVGLLLFPVAPLLWDWWGTRRRDKKNPDRKRFLTFFDRFLLRTLFLNLALLSITLYANADRAFEALSTRGDWMLDGTEGPVADVIRDGLFTMADRLEWLYVSTRDNPFDDPSQDSDVDPTLDELPPDSLGDSDEGFRRQWPLDPQPHPVVMGMPASVETDYQSVARYIGERIEDPFLRVKAIHDWIATRIPYDAEGLRTMNLPSYDPEIVFETRNAVCSGYAKLMQAMAAELDIDVIYVVGDARAALEEGSGLGHAWNAVFLDEHWYLIDVTWDAGHVGEEGFVADYGIDYLLTPPNVFGLNHYPDDDKWQLRVDPISRGDFLRQPAMTPAFYRQGFELLAPDRSQITVNRRAEVRLRNPEGLSVLVTAEDQAGRSTRCAVTGTETTRAICDLPRSGQYRMTIFSAEEGVRQHWSVGHVDVNRR